MFHPFLAASGVLARPFVIEFVDHEDAVAVAEVHELFAVGVVGAADVVETEVFEYSDAFLDRCRVGCGSEGTERVVVGDAFEEQFFAVETEAEVGGVFDAADAECLGYAVGHFSVGGEEGEAECVEVRRVAVPQTR